MIEILLSVSLIGILAAFSMPVYQSFQVKNDLSIAVDTLVQSMRRAQELSRASQGDDTWGVDIRTGSITVFTGESYAMRDGDYDETFAIPTNMAISGGTAEFIFDKLTGEPQSAGSVTLTSVHGEAATITINQKGMIQF
jgi:type II secretory pathway pseudopilin PulG